MFSGALALKKLVRRKKFWRFGIGSLLALTLVVTLARNLIVRTAIEQIGGAVLRNPVTVQQVEVGFQTVRVTGLEVGEATLAGAPQLRIRSICIAPTIWRGLRQGVWARYVVVHQPTLHLRFDREGGLLSQFPNPHGAETGSSLQLPFDRAELVNAAVVIHQAGKSDFTVRGINATMTTAQSLHVHAEIADLLGASLRIDSRIDPSALGGQTHVSLRPLHLDTAQLARLPLVSKKLADHPVMCAVEADLRVRHPGHDFDLRKQDAFLHARVSDVVSQRYGRVTRGIDLRASQRDGRASLVLEGPFAEGELQLNARLNLAAPRPEITAAFRMAGVELQAVSREFAPELPISAIVAAEGSALASWQDPVLTFHAELSPNLTNLNADGIPLEDINAHLVCDGIFDPNCKQPLDGSIRMRAASAGIDLAAAARRWGRRSAAGRIGWNASGTIPLTTLDNPRTYRADFTVRSSRLSCEGIVVRPLAFHGRLRNGRCDVTLPEAILAVAKSAERPTDCAVNQLQLADTLEVRAQLASSVPITRVCDAESWTVSATADVRGVQIGLEPLSDFTARCHFADGKLDLFPFHIRWRDTVCHIAGYGDVRREAGAAVHFNAGPIALRDVSELASRFSDRQLPIAGTAIAEGRINLDLGQFSISARGDLTLSDVEYANTRIGDARLLWEAQPHMARLRSASNDFFGGSYVMDASLTDLDWTKVSVVVGGRDIPLQRLAGALGYQLPATGFVDGGIQFTSIGDLESLRADGWVRTREASFAGTPFDLQTTQLRAADGLVNVAVHGAVFDGSVSVTANTRLSELSKWLQDEARQIHELPVLGHVHVKAAAVKRVIGALEQRRRLAPLSGKFDFHCVRDQAQAEQGILAAVECSTENLRWSETLISKRFKATAALYPTRIEVNSLDGQFADGRLSGDARCSLAQVPSGTFRLRAEHVNLRRALAPILGARQSASGTASVSIGGRLGRTSTADVKIVARNITIGGVAIREFRLPVTCSFRSESAQVQWQSRDGWLNVGGGNVVVRSEGMLTNGRVTTATNLDIRRVDSSKLMQGKSINAGMISGHVDIQSRRARTTKDLTGRFHLELSQVRSLELPAWESLLQMARLSEITQPSIDRTDGGTIDGRFAGGLLHVDNLALSKGGLLVLMDGTSTLEGRLDLDVTAMTTDTGPADSLIALADTPLMLAAPAPLAVLIKANEALKDRVIHIHVGGTSARPSLRLQPGKTLSQDALRFFVSGTLGSRSADIALRRRQTVRY